MVSFMKISSINTNANFAYMYHNAYRASKAQQKSLHEENEKKSSYEHFKSAYRVDFSKEAKELLSLFR